MRSVKIGFKMLETAQVVSDMLLACFGGLLERSTPARVPSCSVGHAITKEVCPHISSGGVGNTISLVSRHPLSSFLPHRWPVVAG